MASKKKNLAKVLGAIILLALAGGALYAATMMRSRGGALATAVPVLPVTVGSFEKTVNSMGELRASKSAVVTSPYQGQIVKLVEEGTAVKEGDPVVWLATTEHEDNLKEEEPKLALAEKDLEAAREDYNLQLLQNEYDMKAEQAKVELAEQKLKDAGQKYETERILVERKISARSQLDSAQLNMLQSGVELRGARINLQKKEENLASEVRVKQTKIDKAILEVEKTQRKIDELKKKISDGTLRAPANGEVSYFKVWKSGTASKIAEGDSVWDRLNLLEVPDRSQMLAIVPVNELDIALVEEGQPVSIYLDAVPGRIFSGVVERKSIVPIENSQMSRRGAAPAQSQGPREFEVKIKLNENEPYFFQGMTASVRIQVAREENALQVPLESLTLRENQIGVYRGSATGPDFIPVEVKATNESMAVVASDLKTGDTIYLRNPRVPLEEAREQGYEALRRVRKQLDGNAEGGEPKVPAGGPPGNGSTSVGGG
jgi:multidrug efflux pump subunit AcrA (membrane-fusion protein)